MIDTLLLLLIAALLAYIAYAIGRLARNSVEADVEHLRRLDTLVNQGRITRK